MELLLKRGLWNGYSQTLHEKRTDKTEINRFTKRVEDSVPYQTFSSRAAKSISADLKIKKLF